MDFRTSTVGGVLKQIRESNFRDIDERHPEVLRVWVCTISPSQTKSFLKFVDENVEKVEQESLHHLKRFRKKQLADKVLIDAIVCKEGYLRAETILSLFKGYAGLSVESESLQLLQLPKEIPLVKEIAQKWSSHFWPMAWKGNPNHQALLASNFDITQEIAIVEKLASTINLNSVNPFVTFIAKKDSKTGHITILFTSFDERDKHPLRHSIMNAIEKVAQDEMLQRASGKNDQLGYLCHDLVVYTSHEPCAMCAMALVHSRIGRLTYLFKHGHGAIESSYFIGDRKDLNWSFDIWRWVGDLRIPPINHVNHVNP